jgi:glutamyl-tRNA(Gln) amidotransferase subunit D
MDTPDPPSDPWTRVRELPVGCTIEIRVRDGPTYRGTLLPRHELSGERVVRLKLGSGYNVGIRLGSTDEVQVVETATNGGGTTERAPPTRSERGSEGAPWVAILSTGGTIASRVDYRTGGVRPVKEEAEILRFYPHLDRDGPVRVIPVLDRLSEEIAPADWLMLAERVAQTFADGARGVVVAHGTDTLAYTAAALSFALRSMPGPVVVVGAQRSPDRPSSDGTSNLLAAVQVARHADFGDVVAVMHAGLSDDRFAIHPGTRVRKMHSSRRDAFRTRNGPPVGEITGGSLRVTLPLRPAVPGAVPVDRSIGSSGGLLWFYPGLEPERAEAFSDGRSGIILAGTGLGHVSSAHLPWIRRAVARGAFVGMTTQCLEGAADPYVYATGRELLRAGVTYLGDILPETAYVKLLFALGNATGREAVARYMLEERAGEFCARHPTEEPAP